MSLHKECVAATTADREGDDKEKGEEGSRRSGGTEGRKEERKETRGGDDFKKEGSKGPSNERLERETGN